MVSSIVTIAVYSKNGTPARIYCVVLCVPHFQEAATGTSVK